MSRFGETLLLFRDLVSRADDDINLPAAALVMARIQHDSMRIEQPLRALDALAEEALEKMAGCPRGEELVRLTKIVFSDMGFEGNSDDYYDPCNSCLNDVIETRTGLPITLSIVYMAIAARCGRPTEGIGFPGHFIVRDVQTGVLLDPFRFGRPLDREELLDLLREQGVDKPQWDDDLVAPVGKRQILERMLNNLRNAYIRRLDPERIEAVDALTRTLAEVRDEGPGSMVQ
jgi:regulator of sirC expression with transglutaminase-like and TPR domain